METSISSAAKYFLKKIFEKRIDLNKDNFDIIIMIDKEIRKTEPNPLIVGMGGMVLFKGDFVHPEEVKQLLKMRDPAKAIYLFSKCYEHFYFSENGFIEKHQLSFSAWLERQAAHFLFIAIEIIFSFCILKSKGPQLASLILFLIAFFTAISIIMDYFSCKNGKEFLHMQEENLKKPHSN